MIFNENWKNTKRELTLRMLLYELQRHKEGVMGRDDYTENNEHLIGMVDGLNYAIGCIEAELGIQCYLHHDRPPKKVKE